MYANYTEEKSRSLLSMRTDKHRQQQQQHHNDDNDEDDDEDDEDDKKKKKVLPARRFSLTLRRPIRRPTFRPPPVPPKRSESLSSITPTTTTTNADTATMTGVRSYLSDDIREKFKSLATKTPTDDSSSPSWRDGFVKNLVATLERRQKDNSFVGCQTPTTARCTPTRKINSKKSHFGQLSPGEKSCTITRVDVEPTFTASLDFSETRRMSSELEDEADKSKLSDFDSSDPDDYFPETWRRQDGSSGNSCSPRAICRAYPTIGGQSDDKPKASGKHSIKKVFSSLVNYWRIGGKGLSRSLRDDCTARESLGDEMLAFRRDTMPDLMKHAAANSRLPDLFVKKSSQRPRRDTRDFAKLIKRPTADRQPDETSPRNTATIRPIYGLSKAASGSQLHLTARHGLAAERTYSSAGFYREPAPPTLDIPRKVRATSTTPAGPATPTSASSRSFDEHLLRASKLRDLQKSLSRDIDSSSSSSSSFAAIKVTSDVTYDVPVSNRPVVVQELAITAATSTDDRRKPLGQIDKGDACAQAGNQGYVHPLGCVESYYSDNEEPNGAGNAGGNGEADGDGGNGDGGGNDGDADGDDGAGGDAGNDGGDRGDRDQDNDNDNTDDDDDDDADEDFQVIEEDEVNDDSDKENNCPNT